MTMDDRDDVPHHRPGSDTSAAPAHPPSAPAPAAGAPTAGAPAAGAPTAVGSLTTVGLAVLWALLWALAFITTKLALRDAAPGWVVGVRCLLAGAVLVTLRIRHLPAARGELGRLTLAGLITTTGYLGVIAFALPQLSAGMAAVLSSGTPLLVVALSVASGRDRLRTVHAAGLVLGVLGIVMSAVDRLSTGVVTVGGIVLGCCAVGCLAVGTFLTPYLVRPGTDLFLATGWQSLTGAVPLLLVTAFTGDLVPPGPGGRLIGLMLYLALGASILGMTLWLLLIRRAGPSRASIAQFMPPLFSIALSAALLGEPVTALETLAVLPVALSTVLTTRH
ncbi:DMT family transporter [Streptomyces sp. NPDC004629]|uniref:DMT family transporter n=1 Tax=Streptomyces sp. NPDC004629 TaxID=3364705 RepID=UPI0036C63A2B